MTSKNRSWQNFDFDEYTRESEPHKKAKSYAWQTAIGLQAVDGLKPSEYLIQTAKKNIDGDISIKEAQRLISKYYESKTDHDSDKDDTEEADKVASHIAQILSERTFNFSPFYFIGIHKRLFEGVFKHAGEFRKYNITKKEWVLHGDTVLYSDAGFLKETLDYDFTQEKEFSYKGLNVDEVIKHLCKFISGIWQIHVFGKGNTRTTAVFTIKYLRTLGFHVTNDAFAKNSWYFRNALVRANYNNLKNGITATAEFLELFFRNLILGETNELKNRYMLAGAKFPDQQPRLNVKLNVKLSGNQKKIFSLLKKNPELTVIALASKVGISRTAVANNLKKLKTLNLLERIGSDKSGTWKVLENGGEHGGSN